MNLNDCPACSGTGKTVGLAAALGRSCPALERVELADREPDQPEGPQVGWVKEYSDVGITVASRPDVLPAALYDLLEGGTDQYDSIEWQRYATADLALSALATAAAKLAHANA